MVAALSPLAARCQVPSRTFVRTYELRRILMSTLRQIPEQRRARGRDFTGCPVSFLFVTVLGIIKIAGTRLTRFLRRVWNFIQYVNSNYRVLQT